MSSAEFIVAGKRALWSAIRPLEIGGVEEKRDGERFYYCNMSLKSEEFESFQLIMTSKKRTTFYLA